MSENDGQGFVLLEAGIALTLERVRLECGHLGERVQEMLVKTPDAIESGEVAPLEEVAQMDDRVDLFSHNHIHDTVTQEETENGEEER